MLRKKMKLDTKRKILDKSRGLFAARGYEAVSMRDISNAVGIRPSAIYNHFASKQTILADLMEGHMERVVGEMTTILDGVACPVRCLTLFARHHLLIHFDYKEDVFLAYYEIRSLEEDNRSRVVVLRDHYEGFLRKTLIEGKDQGRFTVGDPAVHARATLAMLTGITIWYREDGRLARDAIIETYERAVVQSVGLTYPMAAKEQ